MKKMALLILCLLLAISLTGCARTYTYQVERKDQAFLGNRGYIMGEVPEPEPERKRTRTMLGIDIELPPSKEYEVRKKALEEELIRKEPVMPVTEAEETIEEGPVVRVEPGEFIVYEEVAKEVKEKYKPREISYTIQKGDTLQKISKKFYGTTRKWPYIYEVNKETIKSPSRVYPGQVITIPPDIVAEKEAEEKEIK